MSWRDLFRKPHPTLPPDADWPPTATDDWQVGDLAECISPNGWFKGGLIPGEGPKFREIRMVTGVRVDRLHPLVPQALTFLLFARWPEQGFAAAAFRKVTPRADAHERAEPAFIEDLQSQEVA